LRTDVSGTTQAFVRQYLFREGADPKLAEGIAVDMGAAPATVAVSAMENLLAYDEGAALAAMKVPVRLINADLWPTNLESVRRHNPTVELSVMPGVGHFLMIEAADEFNRQLARVISELPGRS
jgi:pimeloyl-ACP methyl ester carboxylesterase